MSKSGNKSARYYPLFLTMDGRDCLVVGGGAVGERKIRTLLKYGARVRIVARELSPWLAGKFSEDAVSWAGKEYREEHLEGACLVFAATSDLVLNRAIAADAHNRGIWCNMAADPELGSFIVPSVVERGPLSIAVSTSGLSPAIAKLLRQKLEREIGMEWEIFIKLLGALRDHFHSRNMKEKESLNIFSALAALPVPEWLKEGNREKAFLKISELCSPVIAESELRSIWNRIWKPFS